MVKNRYDNSGLPKQLIIAEIAIVGTCGHSIGLVIISSNK